MKAYSEDLRERILRAEVIWFNLLALRCSNYSEGRNPCIQWSIQYTVKTWTKIKKWEIKNMVPNFEDKIIHTLHQHLISNFHIINHSYHNYLTWKYPCAIEAVKAITYMDYAISGSAMYGKEEDIFFFVGYDWYLSQGNLKWSEYKVESSKKSIQFIESHVRSMGDEYYYALFPKDQHLSKIRTMLPLFFSDDLCYLGFALDDLGIDEVAWKYKDIRQVMQCYLYHDYIILGGDVYEEKNGLILSTPDSWALKSEKQNQSWNNLNNIDINIEYIENYHKRNRNCGEYLYSIVAKAKSKFKK